MSSLLEVEDIGVRFGGVIALDGLSFAIGAGQICALIGPNGAGKTTLFNVVSRIYQPSSGRVRFEGTDLLALPAHRIADLGVGRTFQNLALVPGLSVLENVMVGGHARSRGGFWASHPAPPAHPVRGAPEPVAGPGDPGAPQPGPPGRAPLRRAALRHAQAHRVRPRPGR